MEKLKIDDVIQYVENNIGSFHKKRIYGLKKLKLKTVLAKKNLYLFKAKNVLTAGEIIKGITDAFLSSKEETMFGDWLEGLAIFVNEKVFNGKKSSANGIDLEFNNEGIRYIVSIKSGPNWGNSSQIKKMQLDFERAIRTLRTSNSKINVVAVNGCCYGIDNNPLKKGNYYKYCGQQFWEFISGNEELYLSIVKPLGHRAKERNDEFIEEYAKMINTFTKEFVTAFCKINGEVDWLKLVRFNSGKRDK